MNGNVKKIYTDHSPLLYFFNYMIYAFILGAFVMYYYVTNYGGQMPIRGTFVNMIKDTWKLIGGFGVLPIALKLYTFWRGRKYQNRRSADR